MLLKQFLLVVLVLVLVLVLVFLGGISICISIGIKHKTGLKNSYREPKNTTVFCTQCSRYRIFFNVSFTMTAFKIPKTFFIGIGILSNKIISASIYSSSKNINQLIALHSSIEDNRNNCRYLSALACWDIPQI